MKSSEKITGSLISKKPAYAKQRSAIKKLQRYFRFYHVGRFQDIFGQKPTNCERRVTVMLIPKILVKSSATISKHHYCVFRRKTIMPSTDELMAHLYYRDCEDCGQKAVMTPSQRFCPDCLKEHAIETLRSRKEFEGTYKYKGR